MPSSLIPSSIRCTQVRHVRIQHDDRPEVPDIDCVLQPGRVSVNSVIRRAPGTQRACYAPGIDVSDLVVSHEYGYQGLVSFCMMLRHPPCYFLPSIITQSSEVPDECSSVQAGHLWGIQFSTWLSERSKPNMLPCTAASRTSLSHRVVTVPADSSHITTESFFFFSSYDGSVPIRNYHCIDCTRKSPDVLYVRQASRFMDNSYYATTRDV